MFEQGHRSFEAYQYFEVKDAQAARDAEIAADEPQQTAIERGIYTMDYKHYRKFKK